MPNYKFPPTVLQEEFSIAWLHAIASAAGYAYEFTRVDYDGIDATIKQRSNGTNIPTQENLAVQLKCTYACTPKNGSLSYPLKPASFNRLSGKRVNPRILVVLHVPRKCVDWLQHGKDQIVLRSCAYWTTLQDQSPTKNKAKVTVPIPTTQQLTVSELTNLMDQLAKDGQIRRPNEG